MCLLCLWMYTYDMSTWVYVRIYTPVDTRVYACYYKFLYVCITKCSYENMSLYVFTWVWLYMSRYVCVRAHLIAYVCMYVRRYRNIWIFVLVYLYISICVYERPKDVCSYVHICTLGIRYVCCICVFLYSCLFCVYI